MSNVDLKNQESRCGCGVEWRTTVMENRQLSASVVITTKNRLEELRGALQSVFAQTVPAEVVVIDDGSTDHTSEMVVREFPAARLFRNEVSAGLIAARNQAARIARGDLIFSIDDDAVFTTPEIIQQTLALFTNPIIGAVAIPYIDVKKSPEVRQLAPSLHEIWITDRYIGTSHAVRRELFLSLNGYREFLVHQGEERDFCTRLFNAGYVVRLGTSDVIHHFESPKRDTRRMDLYGRRNDVLFAVLNVPHPWLMICVVGTTVRGILFGLRVGRPLRMLHGLVLGYIAAVRYWRHRRAVRPDAMAQLRRIQKIGAVRLRDFPVRQSESNERTFELGVSGN